MFCPNCGRENKTGAKFCGGCGRTLGNPQQSKSSPPKEKPVKVIKKEKKNRGNVWLSVALCVVMVILVVCLVGLVARFIFPEEDVKETDEQVATDESTNEPTQVGETPWWEFPVDASYEETEEYCAQLEAQGDYLSAVRYLNNRLAEGEEDTRYLQMQSRYESMHVASVMDVVNAYTDRGQYQLALETLRDAEELYSCDTFLWAREDLEERLRVPLTACQKLEDTNSLGKEDDITKGSWRDSFGNTHDASLRFWVVDKENFHNTEYITYALDGRYTTLTGQIVASEQSGKNSHGVIMIYLDGDLVYTSQKIYYTTQPVEFEIDVTDAQQIRVVCTTESSEFNYTILEAGLSEY